MDNVLKGKLCFKGARGYSAYEIAVQNGFKGSEKDWLAQLGTTVIFNKDSVVHVATEGQTIFDIPATYTNGSSIEIYVDGSKLNPNQYTIDTNAGEINLVGVTLKSGAMVEIVVEFIRCE